MPIHQSLWRLTDTAERLSTAQLQTEKQLEDFIPNPAHLPSHLRREVPEKYLAL